MPGRPANARSRPGRTAASCGASILYWRYEQTENGVIVECESISLSRAVPSLLAGTVRPLIDHVARGSMERTLSSMRVRFAN